MGFSLEIEKTNKNRYIAYHSCMTELKQSIMHASADHSSAASNMTLTRIKLPEFVQYFKQMRNTGKRVYFVESCN